jgi:hypothetical protein
MAIYRVQIGFPFDSVFPRDVVTINPHYLGDNAQAIVDRIKANLIASTHVGAAGAFTIKAYDATKAPPSYPIAQATNGTGFWTSIAPKEVSLCLSYFAAWNRPTFRGRLYIPNHFIGGTLGQRPTPTQRQSCADWATLLTSGMSGQSLAVYSRKMKTAAGVTDWWVDDEWDIQRSRGGKPTTRLAGTLPG